MNRVLSFPQSHTCDNPSEVVSKRFCFSCIFSVSFLSVIFGYLLGSKETPVINSCPFTQVNLDEQTKCIETLRMANCSYNKTQTYLNVHAEYVNILKKCEQSIEDKELFYSETNFTNYDEAVRMKRHFEKYKFDEVSPIIASNLSLMFKNKNKPDVLEIVLDQGQTRYTNLRNATYSYFIPSDAKNIVEVTNQVSGLPVYGNYGSEDDFYYLSMNRISLRECIILLRLGKISILEKVTNAFKRGVNGVLLFADPQQYPHANNFIATEEMSPTLLANLQKVYNYLEVREGSPHIGIPVQIIEAITAQNILREITGLNKSPDSWRGSLNALYSFGPGFVFQGRLILYSHFINVNYTSYDVAAYLRGDRELDRYIILGNSRKTLASNEETFENINTLMAVSKALSKFKHNDHTENFPDWRPARTIIFCSFGLAEAEIYSEDSWLQVNKHLVNHRTVAYFNIKNLPRDLGILSVNTSPVFLPIAEYMSDLIENPEKYAVKTPLGVEAHPYGGWYSTQKSDEANIMKYVENRDSKILIYSGRKNSELEMTRNALLASFDVPFITISYTALSNERPSSENRSYPPYIFNYKKALIKLWTFLSFSLANNVVLPFNFSAYRGILINFYKKLYENNEKYLKDINLMDDFEYYGDLIKNLSKKIETFQNGVNQFMLEYDTLIEYRILSEKFIQIYRLLRCSNFHESDKFSISTEYSYPVFLSLQEVLNKIEINKNDLISVLKQSRNCVNEIHHLMNGLIT